MAFSYSRLNGLRQALFELSKPWFDFLYETLLNIYFS